MSGASGPDTPGTAGPAVSGGEPDPPPCHGCGEPVAPEDRFCGNCGQNLRVRRTPVGGPGADDLADTCQTCAGAGFDEDGFCEVCGRPRPAGRDHMECDLGQVAGVCDKGKRRARNEDSMAFGCVRGTDGEQTVVAVVCDGVATSDRADNASQLAVDAALEILIDGVLDGRDPEEATGDAVAKAIKVVSAIADPGVPGAAPSCTYVSTVITPERVTVGWIGDSRVYWLGEHPDNGAVGSTGAAGSSRSLTVDDTVATELMAEGMSEQEALSMHHAHALSRWIGADAGEIEPRVQTIRPDHPGLVLLCSDGLWNYLPEARSLVDALPAGTNGTQQPPMAVADEFTRLALEYGGHDNITVVVVPFPPGTEPDATPADNGTRSESP